MSEIIGRENEVAELSSAFNSGKSEFVAVYGRRRVGKTYLVRNYFNQKKCNFFYAVGMMDGSLDVQLQNFSESFSEAFLDKLPIKPMQSWKEAFHRLTEMYEKQGKDKKFVVFLDELPWMSTAKSGLLEALDYYWNRYWVNLKNFKLIICGSSASWILKKIIFNRGGLHNRVTRQINLQPFSLYETKQYIKSLNCKFNDKQILEIYMAIGGIPFYLNNLKNNLSAVQNINNICFQKNGILFDEFEKLFQSLFIDSEAYIELIRVIASKQYGISRKDVTSALKLTAKGGTLTERLKGLEEAGFIMSFAPFGKTKAINYKVIDEFVLFYLRWIEPEKSSLIRLEKNSNFWDTKYKTPSWNNWAGYAFESVCYKHISLIKRALKIPSDSRASIWQKKTAKNSSDVGAQIDLLFDRTDDCITICEIKYTIEPFVIDKAYAKNIQNKIEVFKKTTKNKKQVLFAMISAEGVKQNLNSISIIADDIKLADLMKTA